MSEAWIKREGPEPRRSHDCYRTGHSFVPNQRRTAFACSHGCGTRWERDTAVERAVAQEVPRGC